MSKLRIMKKRKNNKIIGKKIKLYIIFSILICCSIITFNIHPSNNTDQENGKMTYIFHDYEGNEYILNDTIHGAADSLDFLFNDEVPEAIKGNHGTNDPIYTDSVSLSNNGENNNQHESGNIKDNQISLENIMSDLGIDSEDNNLVINVSNDDDKNDGTSYSIKEEIDDSTLIIEKENTQNNREETEKTLGDDESLTAKTFSYIKDGRVIPILVPWDDLQIKEYNDQLNNNSVSETGNGYAVQKINKNKSEGPTIIDDYADCMTPRGYKIVHGDSILAYKQLDNAPDICNIERRYCRNGKLSGTYTQQGCSENKNYTYKSRGEANVPQKQEEIKGGARQNPDGSVTVKNSEVGGSFVFDRPNKSSTEFGSGDNIREESEGIEQTKRPYRDCTAPRGEKISHGQYIYAYKHGNGFSDAPCEVQLRLCSMGELLGTYTESSCKTRDTSFIDRINGSPTRQTYSEEKLERVKKQIENEKIYYENARKNATKSTNSDALDKILYILEED